MKKTNNKKTINISKLVGKGYGNYWNSKKRYNVVKGGRGSKKSKTTALWMVYNIMKYPLSNGLVVRKVFKDLSDSCMSDIKWACNQLGVSHLWKFTASPLKATYKPTGQLILFRGLDNPTSITSISVPVGVLNFAWLNILTTLNHLNSWKPLT